MHPKVSIITPLHNKGPYIAETIESVRTQSFRDWEMLLIENYSTDEGPEVARSFAAKDERVRLVEAPPEVRGPGAARNLGIQESRGDWIQFLDADDLLLPGHFESQVRTVEANPDADIVTCDWLEGPGMDLCERKRPTNSRPGADCSAAAIAFTPWVVHAAWVKRSALGDPPWWDTSFDREVAEDHVFWFKVLLEAKPAYSDHVGAFYRTETAARRHDKSETARYLRVVDRAILTNIELLHASGKALGYPHRKLLLNSYLEQSLAQTGNADLETQILERAKTFRPKMTDALRRRDWATLASYFIPLRAVAKIQRRRRAGRLEVADRRSEGSRGNR